PSDCSRPKMIQNPGVMTPREGRSMPQLSSTKSYSVRAARSSPLPLWERSETERSEVSGRGVTYEGNCPSPHPSPRRGEGAHCRCGEDANFNALRDDSAVSSH